MNLLKNIKELLNVLLQEDEEIELPKYELIENEDYWYERSFDNEK